MWRPPECGQHKAFRTKRRAGIGYRRRACGKVARKCSFFLFSTAIYIKGPFASPLRGDLWILRRRKARPSVGAKKPSRWPSRPGYRVQRSAECSSRKRRFRPCGSSAGVIACIDDWALADELREIAGRKPVCTGTDRGLLRSVSVSAIARSKMRGTWGTHFIGRTHFNGT